MRWNLLAFGGGLLFMLAMVLFFLDGKELAEPAWLLIGTAVGGFIGYAMAVVQALTAPGDPAPQVTEKTMLEAMDKVNG